jgi:hypothetical protein
MKKIILSKHPNAGVRGIVTITLDANFKTNIGKSPKRELVVLLGPSQIILGIILLTKRKMQGKKISWRTWAQTF